MQTENGVAVIEVCGAGGVVVVVAVDGGGDDTVVVGVVHDGAAAAVVKKELCWLMQWVRQFLSPPEISEIKKIHKKLIDCQWCLWEINS